MELPKLFGTDKRGQLREWSVHIKGSEITRSHGLVDGKKTISKRSFTAVNVGKSNESSADNQAYLNAQREWIKYAEKGYKPDCKDKLGRQMMRDLVLKKKDAAFKVAFETGGKASVVRDDKPGSDMLEVRAMTCKKWCDEQKCYKYFDFDKGVFIQPKLDGTRATAQLTKNGVVLMSRGKQGPSQPFPFLTKLKGQIGKFLKKHPKIILDGELYAHELHDANGELLPPKDRFEVLSAMAKIRRKTPHALEDQMQYHVYDIVDPTGKLTQEERLKILNDVFKNNKIAGVEKVLTRIIDDPKQININVEEYLSRGYEGAVVRAHDLTYEQGKEALRMRKVKNFQDAEFKVVGTNLKPGVPTHTFTFQMEDDKGVKFKATPAFSQKMKTDMYRNRDKYIGQYATVRFMELTGKNQVPRHGNVVGFRADLGV